MVMARLPVELQNLLFPEGIVSFYNSCQILWEGRSYASDAEIDQGFHIVMSLCCDSRVQFFSDEHVWIYKYFCQVSLFCFSHLTSWNVTH